MRDLVSKGGSKPISVLLALLLIFSLIPGLLLTNTQEAYGADIPNVGDSFQGSCYIGDSWMVGDQSYFNVDGFTGELAGCWAVGSYYCEDHTAAEPSHVGATYSARVTAVNVEEGWVEYYVYITPPGVTDGVTRDGNGLLLGYQHVGGHVRVAKEFGGYLELYKSSANTDITDGNACYAFEGAVFNVYNESGKHVTTLTTNKDGYAKTTERLPFGKYNVIEIKAPKGYALDKSDHWVEITAKNDATATLRLKDKPQGDPAAVFVGKIDADTTKALPQGDTSLKGAEFRIDYYDGYYTTQAQAEASGKPTRIWTIKTDADGLGRLRESSLVSGSDALYKNSYGDATIPLGSVLIRETKAPTDYVLPNPVPVSVQQVTSSGELENVSTYNYPKVPDIVKRGDIAITKAYDPTPDEDTGVMVPEANITFDFYASHQFEGATPKSGVSPAFSLTTDKEGYADTKNLYLIENEDGTYSKRARKADDKGALPHDTYLMVQRTVVEGLEKVDPMVITVAENGKTYSYLLQNGQIQTPLKVVKVDSETGKVVPYPASWQIIDMKTGAPVSMTTHYPVTETFDVFTSDSEGRLTLPEKLAHGDYELKEVEAPAAEGTGYLLNPVNIAFSTSDGYDWDNPLEVVFADAPAKGKIEIMKTDDYTGEPVERATYVIQAVEDIYTLDGTLRAANGDVVDTITTDEFGCAVSKELYLGHYDVIEAISPDGFALDTTRYGVSLEYADQTVPVVTETVDVTDVPTTLQIEKVDSITGESLAEVEFKVVSDEGDFEEIIVTDEDGLADISYLKHGAYSVTEVTTPFGYVTNDEVYHFIIDDQGLIEGKSLYTLRIENTPIQVSFSKVDITTTLELPGCGMEIYAADEEGQPTGDVLHEWESTGEPYAIVGGLEPGDYVLKETYPAPGYVTAKELLFTVEDTGEIQSVVMEDDYTKVDISKRDITTDEELPGARIAIFEADDEGKRTGKFLYEWISADKPYRVERLAPGDYILHEDTAPVGYELAQDIKFTVEESGEVLSVVMHDKPTPEEEIVGKGYDKTGFDPMLLIVLLILLASGGMLGLGIGIKRHHRKTHPKEEGEEFIIPRGEDLTDGSGEL